MTLARRVSFYVVVAGYTAYNIGWLTGAMLADGRTDTPREVFFFCFTFLADIPTFFVLARKPALGFALFSLLLVISMALAASQHVLNGSSLLYWYVPKLFPLATSALISKSTPNTP
jgi:hypothetical protein